MKNVAGIIPALLTPFDNNNKINEKVLAELIERNIKQGVSGFYVAGSTAEVFLLSKEERLDLYRTVKSVVGDRVALIAHVGDISTESAVQYAAYAEKLGYDMISAVAPFYYKFSIAQIKKYYYDLVNASTLPMLVYNIPAFSGTNFSNEDFGEFLQNDKFCGIKFTSNDLFQMERLKTAYPNKLIFNGYDEVFLSGLAAGADGGIGSTYNFMADKFIKIQQLFKAGKIEEAKKIQQQANRIISVFSKYGGIESEKLIMNLLGYDFGTARAPFSKPCKEMVEYFEKNVMELIV